jgi:glutamate dehydrogenase/leucine dehydrogenase
VAQYTVEKLNALGAKAITLSDSDGTIVDPDGINPEKLAWVMELKNVRRGRIREYADHFKGAQYLPGKRPWSVPCDLAFPSATQNEVDEDDARQLVQNGCYCVAEGANMPSRPEAVEVFLDAKILYGPGKAANAGGVAVSGLEMTQNAGCMRRSREEVDEQLQRIMRSIHENCVTYGRENGFVNYVQGANIAGFIKVADAMVAQGYV